MEISVKSLLITGETALFHLFRLIALISGLFFLFQNNREYNPEDHERGDGYYINKRVRGRRFVGDGVQGAQFGHFFLMLSFGI